MAARDFLCPHCQARLRFADESLIDRQFACPDCRKGVEILRGDGAWTAVPAKNFVAAAVDEKQAAASTRKGDAQPKTAGTKVGPQAPSPPVRSSERLAEWIGQHEAEQPEKKSDRKTPSGGVQPRRSSRIRERAKNSPAPWFGWLQSPIAVTWTVAGFATLTIIVWLLRDNPPSSIGHANASRAANDIDDEQESDGRDDPALALSPSEQQLSLLGGRIDAFQLEHGRFPAGHITFHADDAESRFSWIAELESQFPSTSRPGPIPLWDRGWQDPINDGFVRRRLPALINPALNQQAGDDGYPATHFVGVAGLGVDGPTLPANHPRAGIFGDDRVTRPEDVQDGLSNTIMVAGVQDQLGSWADGNTSIRPLTEAPYVNGPDGFGTGQSDGMFILMADGSVKFVSNEIDPVVMRRMTAMADGLPLDPAVPGDPLDITPPVMIAEADPPIEDVEPEPPEVVDPADPAEPETPELSPEMAALLNEPIEVPIAIDPPRVFIERSLQVSLRRFEQREPVELRAMLQTLEELIGSPFGWNVPDNDEWVGILERDVTVSLENTTVEGVLSEVLTSVGLTYRLEDEGIYIEPK